MAVAFTRAEEYKALPCSVNNVRPATQLNPPAKEHSRGARKGLIHAGVDGEDPTSGLFCCRLSLERSRGVERVISRTLVRHPQPPFPGHGSEPTGSHSQAAQGASPARLSRAWLAVSSAAQDHASCVCAAAWLSSQCLTSRSSTTPRAARRQRSGRRPAKNHRRSWRCDSSASCGLPLHPGLTPPHFRSPRSVISSSPGGVAGGQAVASMLRFAYHGLI